MDFDEDLAGPDVTSKKGKKSVVIDDKRDIKFINVESEPSNTRSSSYMDLYEWPWRIIISLFLIGYLFEIMAYATPYWMITSDANDNDVMSVGLWSACTTISNCTFRGDDAGMPCFRKLEILIHLFFCCWRGANIVTNYMSLQCIVLMNIAPLYVFKPVQKNLYKNIILHYTFIIYVYLPTVKRCLISLNS